MNVGQGDIAGVLGHQLVVDNIAYRAIGGFGGSFGQVNAWMWYCIDGFVISAGDIVTGRGRTNHGPSVVKVTRIDIRLSDSVVCGTGQTFARIQYRWLRGDAACNVDLQVADLDIMESNI